MTYSHNRTNHMLYNPAVLTLQEASFSWIAANLEQTTCSKSLSADSTNSWRPNSVKTSSHKKNKSNSLWSGLRRAKPPAVIGHFSMWCCLAKFEPTLSIALQCFSTLHARRHHMACRTSNILQSLCDWGQFAHIFSWLKEQRSTSPPRRCGTRWI